MRVETGGYTGNATDDTQVNTTLGTPAVVFVQEGTEIGSDFALTVRWAAMGTGNSMESRTTGLITDGIKSFNGSGFTVGTNDSVNNSGREYWWLALFDDPGLPNFEAGAYTGDEVQRTITTGLTVTPGGFTSEAGFVLVIKGSVSQFWPCRFGTNNASIDDTYRFLGAAAAKQNNQIRELTTTSFTVSTSTAINESGVTYYYLFIPRLSSGGVPVANMRLTTYDETDPVVDDRTITISGTAQSGRPVVYAYIREQTTINRQSAHRFGVTGDNSWTIGHLTAVGSQQADQIQSLGTDSVVLGTHGDVQGIAGAPVESYVLLTLNDFLAAEADTGGRSGDTGFGGFVFQNDPYTLFKSMLDVYKRYQNVRI